MAFYFHVWIDSAPTCICNGGDPEIRAYIMDKLIHSNFWVSRFNLKLDTYNLIMEL